MNRIAVIVVTYNRIELLKECIDSIRNQTFSSYSIIVVNNGSTDSTAEWLLEQTDVITITQENVGGAGGFFTGIKYACEHGYEYSWIMDDDVIVTPNALQNLIDATLYGNGFICSRVVDVQGNNCNVPKISNAKSETTGEPIWGQYIACGLLRTDITSFVSVLLPSRIVYELGLPHSEYFIWGDDTEYTSRISAKYPSYMAINSIVIHKRKISSVLSIFTEEDPGRIRNYFYAYRNRIHNQKKVYRKILLFVYSLYEGLRLLFRRKYYACFIVLKGTLASVFFHPTIKFPSEC